MHKIILTSKFGKRKKRKVKNPQYLNNKTVNTIVDEMGTKSKKHIEEDNTDMRNHEDMVPSIIEYVLAQCNLRQGLAKFGDKAQKATEKELLQIHNMNALKPLDASILMVDEKRNSIASLIFLTEKRDDTLKARQCANGRKQQNYMTKDKSISPTVSTESIFWQV